MKRKGFLLILMLILVFGAVQVATAADETSADKKQQKADRVNLVEELKLTEDQISDWQDIKERAYQDTRDLRIDLMDLQHELDLLILDGDEDKISAKQEEIKTIRDKVVEIEKEYLEDFKDLLTEDQQSILEKNGGKGPGLGLGLGHGPGTGPGFEGEGQRPDAPDKDEE